MSTQYRLVQSGKTASGGCSAATDYYYYYYYQYPKTDGSKMEGENLKPTKT
jgi:hypothetical protein